MRSTLTLTEQQVRQAIADGRKLLGVLEKDLAALFARATPADGYPSRSGGGRSHDKADPTARAAELRISSKEHPAPAGKALHRLWQGVTLLGHANSYRAEALPPELTKPVDDQDWCTHCLSVSKGERDRTRIFSPRGIGKDVPAGCPLCTWCYQFERANGTLPSADLVRKHEQGVRITQRMIDDARAAASTVGGSDGTVANRCETAGNVGIATPRTATMPSGAATATGSEPGHSHSSPGS